ncbi:MAG: globin [Nitriliruptoraceae bacterium]
MAASSPLEPHQVHDVVGGQPAFDALVESFYDRVEADELLRPMYPDDLGPGKRHLALFLAQYWGGGDVYGRERGHPRLRRRHAPFPVTPEAALRWAEHMTAAVRAQGWPEEAEALVLAYVARATPTLINQLPPEVAGSDGPPRSS